MGRKDSGRAHHRDSLVPYSSRSREGSRLAQTRSQQRGLTLDTSHIEWQAGAVGGAVGGGGGVQRWEGGGRWRGQSSLPAAVQCWAGSLQSPQIRPGPLQGGSHGATESEDTHTRARIHTNHLRVLQSSRIKYTWQVSLLCFLGLQTEQFWDFSAWLPTHGQVSRFS